MYLITPSMQQKCCNVFDNVNNVLETFDLQKDGYTTEEWTAYIAHIPNFPWEWKDITQYLSGEDWENFLNVALREGVPVRNGILIDNYSARLVCRISVLAAGTPTKRCEADIISAKEIDKFHPGWEELRENTEKKKNEYLQATLTDLQETLELQFKKDPVKKELKEHWNSLLKWSN